MRKPTVSSESVAGDQLQAFIERIERMNEEKRAINDDVKEIYAEAKGNGFDTKAIKIIVHKRAQDHSERMELEAIVELYEAAIGMRGYPDDDDHEVVAFTHAPAPARESASRVPDQLSDARNMVADINEPAVAADPTGAGLNPLSPSEEAAPPVNQSTAARMDVHQGSAGIKPADNPAPLTQQGFATPGSTGNGVGRPQPATLQSETGARSVPSRAGTVEPAGVESRPSILTRAVLSELFEYDATSGWVTWKIDAGTSKAGDRSGFLRPTGYRMIQIEGRRYQEHRVAWVLAHGELPKPPLQIDHANRIKDDNRLANLRAATLSQQQINTPTQKNNRHGRGVTWRADRSKWRTEIYVNGNRVDLGSFDAQEDAQAAYQDAAAEFYGEFAPEQATPVDTIPEPARKGGSPDSHVAVADDADAAVPSLGEAQRLIPEPERAAVDTNPVRAKNAHTAAPIPEPGNGGLSETLSTAIEATTEPFEASTADPLRSNGSAEGQTGGSVASAAPVASPSSRDGLYSVDWLRRHGYCRDARNCIPSPGRLCIGCSRTMAVEAGGTSIPHQGLVNA